MLTTLTRLLLPLSDRIKSVICFPPSFKDDWNENKLFFFCNSHRQLAIFTIFEVMANEMCTGYPCWLETETWVFALRIWFSATVFINILLGQIINDIKICFRGLGPVFCIQTTSDLPLSWIQRIQFSLNNEDCLIQLLQVLGNIRML